MLISYRGASLSDSYYIVKNRFTGKRHVILGHNMYYPWLLNMQCSKPAKDWLFPNSTILVRLFFKLEKAFTSKWVALETL